jgi:hypothetical protein
MLHACLCTICFAFCYTSWNFYAFSRTNLLTRCHSASSLFSTIFVFQKSYTGNILRIGRNKDQNSYFSRMKDEDRKRAKGGGRGQAHQGVACPPSWPRQGVVTPHWWPSDAASPPIKSLRMKNTTSVSIFPRIVPQHRHRRRQILGDISLCSGALPGRGSAPEPSPSVSIAISAVSIDLTAISIAVAASDDEEGVVLPRG